MITNYLKDFEVDEKLLKGSHSEVIKGAKNKNVVALSIINTKKLSRKELVFVFEILEKYPNFIFFDVHRISIQNKYIFVKPYSDEQFEIID